MIRALNPPLLKPPMQSEVQNEPVARESLERNHECRDAPIRGILISATVIVLMTAGCMALVWIALAALAKSRPFDASATARGVITAPDLRLLQRFPTPNLQVNPHDDLVALRAREEAELNGYGWVNRSNGMVRIPVERAMELILQRLPVRNSNAPPKTGKSPLEMIQERAQER